MNSFTRDDLYDGLKVSWPGEFLGFPGRHMRGVVRGIATMDLPVMGPQVIVESEGITTGNYPFTCSIAPLCALMPDV